MSGTFFYKLVLNLLYTYFDTNQLNFLFSVQF